MVPEEVKPVSKKIVGFVVLVLLCAGALYLASVLSRFNQPAAPEPEFTAEEKQEILKQLEASRPAPSTPAAQAAEEKRQQRVFKTLQSATPTTTPSVEDKLNVLNALEAAH